MTPSGADPFDDLETSNGPKPFAIGFDKSSSDGLVYGSAILGGIFVVISIAAQLPPMALAALLPLVVAFWHYPMADRRTPQLGANAEGLFVERIGFIDWAAVRRFDLARTSVRNIRLVTLEVSLNRPLQESVIRPQLFPLWKSVMIRSWKVRHQENGDDTLLIQLHPLTNDPEEIVNRLQAFRDV